MTATSRDDGTATLTKTGPAEPYSVAEFRRLFRRWIDDVMHVDAERKADMVLAADEALSNCADHAYRDRGSPGLMTLEATYDPGSKTVKASVTDHGTWIEPASPTSSSVRGRGLLLMRALSDELTIDSTAQGTTVCLSFRNVRPSRDRLAQPSPRM
jgi:serine/threonine-protein kinase RsbW